MSLQPDLKVKLFLGAIGGEVTAELPFVLMHPKPDMRRMIKVDHHRSITYVAPLLLTKDHQKSTNDIPIAHVCFKVRLVFVTGGHIDIR